jgi:hypothetical protein
MTARARVRSYTPVVQGGGGGGPTPGGNIAWEPGDSAEPLTAASAVDMTKLALAGEFGAAAAADLSKLALAGELASGGTLTMPALEIVGNVSAGAGITALQFSIDSLRCVKDASYNDVAVCTGSDTNDNGNFMTCDPLVTANKVGVFAFNLAPYPAGTCTAGALTSYLIGSATTSGADGFYAVSDGSEGWSESGVRCSSKLTQTGYATNTATSFHQTSGYKTRSLVTLGLNKVTGRLGVGECTFMLRPSGSQVGTSTWSAIGHPTGYIESRLSLTWTVAI